jgi:hypothetical protein
MITSGIVFTRNAGWYFHITHLQVNEDNIIDYFCISSVIITEQNFYVQYKGNIFYKCVYLGCILFNNLVLYTM